MARKNKIGLDYFPLDIDFFDDDKIQLIAGEFGVKGEYLVIRLLAKIYSTNGYFYQWGNDESILFAKRVGDGFTGALVNEIVSRLVKRGFFNETIFNSSKILTSRGIQKRYFEACERRKKVDVRSEILLVNPLECDNVNINVIDVDINAIDYNISTQSKVKEKESKVNKKENARGADDLIFPFDSENFLQAWNLWKNYRREQHRFVFKNLAEQAALKDLSELCQGSEEKAIAIIHQSINKGWAGLFQLKIQNQHQNGNRKNEPGTKRPILLAAEEALRRASGDNAE